MLARAFVAAWLTAVVVVFDWYLVVEAEKPHVTAVGCAAMGLVGALITVCVLTIAGWALLDK